MSSTARYSCKWLLILLLKGYGSFYKRKWRRQEMQHHAHKNEFFPTRVMRPVWGNDVHFGLTLSSSECPKYASLPQTGLKNNIIQQGLNCCCMFTRVLRMCVHIECVFVSARIARLAQTTRQKQAIAPYYLCRYGIAIRAAKKTKWPPYSMHYTLHF